MLLFAPSPHSQGDHQESKHRDARDHQHHGQNGHAQVHLPVNTLVQSRRMPYLVQLQSEKEEGRVVVYRRDIVRVLLRKSVRIVARNQGENGFFWGRKEDIAPPAGIALQVGPNLNLLFGAKARFLASTTTGIPSSSRAP